MVQYSEHQMKEDLAILNIKEDTKLTSSIVTSNYKKLAKIQHPDKKTGNKDAFQKLHNAFERLSAMVEEDPSKHSNDDSDEYEKEFFRTSNFPLEKKNCFVVIVENRLSDHWEHVLTDLYGIEKYLETGGKQFKVQSMTLSFYNKPKKDNKTKILIQGKDKDAIVEYV